METPGRQTRPGGRLRTRLSLLGVGLLMAAGGAVVATKLYLATPQASRQLGEFLSGRLGERVTVAGLELAGGSVRLHGLTLGDRPGSAGLPLSSCRLLDVRPRWLELLQGNRRFAAVRLSGLAISLEKGGDGTWNFTPLQRRLAGKKGGGETVIDHLFVDDSTVTVNGRRVRDLRLAVTGLASRGAKPAAFSLSGRDDRGNRFALAGSGRLGADPAFSVTGGVPTYSLAPWQRPGSRLQLAGASAELRLSAHLRKGVLTAAADATLGGAAIGLPGGVVPISSTLTLTGNYRLADDTLELASCRLEVNRLLRLRLKGRMRGVKGGRAFQGELGWEELAVERLLALVPPPARRGLALAGSLQPGVLLLGGDAGGVRRLSGGISFRDGRLGWGGKGVAEKLALDLVIGSRPGGWQVSGSVRARGAGAATLVETLELPIILAFDGRLRLLEAAAPALTARLLGATASGSLAYEPAAKEPLRGSITIDRLELAELGRFLPGRGVAIAVGSGSLSCTVAGKRPAELGGRLVLALKGVRGEVAGKPVSLAEGGATGVFGLRARALTMDGEIGLRGGQLAGTPLAASFGFRLAERELVISQGSLSFGEQRLQVAQLRGFVPPPRPAGAPLPLRLAWSGVEVSTGKASIGGGSGSLSAELHREGGRSWLSGSGVAAVERLAIGGNEVGGVAAGFTLREGELALALSGRPLAGRLAATVSLDPFAAARGVRFAATLTDAEAARVADFWRGGNRPAFSDGLLSVTASGSFLPGSDPAGRITLAGRGLALVDAKGKSLVGGAGLNLRGELAAGTLRLQEGSIGLAEGVNVAVSGELRNPFTPRREGSFTCRLASTPLTALFDLLANRLPRPLQETEADGNLALSARLALTGNGMTVEGTTEWDDVRLEIPAHKLSLGGVRGSLPFSLDLAGTAAPYPRPPLAYSRENYPRLLAAFAEAAGNGSVVRIGRLRFGTVELTGTVIRMRAARGLTEVTSMESLLYRGRLLGKGFFRLGNGPQYGGNMLLDGLSLRSFCEAIPAIKGYISGRVDGIVSLYGEGEGGRGLVGFVDLWSRNSPDEKMLVSREFLQRLAGKKLKGFFFRSDRAFDRGEISASLEKGYLTFEVLDISHTNLFGIRDLSVSVAPVQNRIALDHLMAVVKEAASRGRAVSGGEGEGKPVETEFKWSE